MAAAPTARVHAIDGLRGIAAFVVVLFHLHGAISRTATEWLWAPLNWVAEQGYLGVDIFFVISGFVIALSVSRGAPTLGYFGRFIIRRSIRLDPPYWAAIALEMLLLWLTLRLFSGYEVQLPSTAQLVAHFAYAQELLGYGSIINIFWTLCYEVQFYAFFVSLVVLQANLPRRLRTPAVTGLGFGLLFVLSLWTRYWRPEWLPFGLAIDRWFQFSIGALTWWALTKPGRMLPLLSAWLLLAASVVAAGASATQFLAILVSVVILAGVRRPKIGAILALKPLQFLGAISYSLYLYHSSVGWRYVSLVQRLVPGPWDPPMALLVYATGVLGCIAVSAALWWAIERPFLKLSHRVRLPQRAPDPTPPL